MPTYYVRASGGNNGNDGLSFANAWATLNYAESAVVAGDTIVVCADGIHAPTATIAISNSTTRITPVKWVGGNATGVVDGTMATISGVSTPVNEDLIYSNSQNHASFQYLRFTEGKRDNIQIGSLFFAGCLRFVNCRIDNAVRYGFNDYGSNNLKIYQFVNVEIDHNGDSGVGGTSATAGDGHYLNCSIHDNGAHGLSLRNYYKRAAVIGCRIYRNTGSGIYTNNNALNHTSGYNIINNVFLANGVHGICFDKDDSDTNVLVNNIFRSNGGYGVYTANTSTDQLSFCDSNCSSNNASGHININGGVFTGENNIYTDPMFVSEIAGSENFRLRAASPCLSTGYGYSI